MKKLLLLAAVITLGITIPPVANAQMSIGAKEAKIENNKVQMQDRAKIECEQKNSGGANAQACGQIVVAQSGVGSQKAEVRGNTVTMRDSAEIKCKQKNSGGANTQSCGQIVVN